MSHRQHSIFLKIGALLCRARGFFPSKKTFLQTQKIAAPLSSIFFAHGGQMALVRCTEFISVARQYLLCTPMNNPSRVLFQFQNNTFFNLIEPLYFFVRAIHQKLLKCCVRFEKEVIFQSVRVLLLFY